VLLLWRTFLCHSLGQIHRSLDWAFIIALMLSLLIFIGEAVRDAFDPRKTFA
jgi:ABC-type microcin C transport system permease subunit YejE